MRIVEGPGSVSDDRWIVSLNRPDLGVIAAVARPSSEGFWSLSAAVHRALGQQEPKLAATARDRVLLGVWVAAYRIQDVIIHHADRYPAEVMLEVDRILTAAGARTWLVVDASIHPLVVQDLEALGPIDPASWADFRAHWRTLAAEPPGVTAGAMARLDPVPAWAVQHDRLVRASERGMDLPYLEGFCAAASWTRSARPRKVKIAAHMRECLARYDDRECLVQAVRGVAVALHQTGWQVTLDLQRLAQHGAGAPLARPGDIARLGQIRHFRDPAIAATTALASLELTRDEILGIELGDVAVNGDLINLWHDSLEVPAVVRPILRAQRISRLRDGARAVDAFLTDGRQPLSVRRFATIVLAGLEEIGASIPWIELDERPGADERWLLERGIALSWISRVDRRSIGPAGVSGVAVLAQVVGRLANPEAIARRPACRCGHQHEPPQPPKPDTWPWIPQHASPAADHPHRSLLRPRTGA